MDQAVNPKFGVENDLDMTESMLLKEHGFRYAFQSHATANKGHAVRTADIQQPVDHTCQSGVALAHDVIDLDNGPPEVGPVPHSLLKLDASVLIFDDAVESGSCLAEAATKLHHHQFFPRQHRPADSWSASACARGTHR